MSNMYAQTGHGILIPERAVDADLVRRELKRLDPGLLLVRDFSPRHKSLVWSVLHRLGENETIPVFRWADPDGTPRPLSYGLVEAFKAQDGHGRELYAAAEARNRERQERLDRDLDEQIDEIVRDMAPRIRGAVSTPPPRGIYLRRARDRQRAKGRDV